MDKSRVLRKLTENNIAKRHSRASKYVDQRNMKKSPTYRLMNHFIEGHMDRYSDPYEIIGYSVLGPLLYGFTTWLRETIPADETIVFLAREGALIQKAFQIVSNRPSSYMYISRRAVGLARLAVTDNPDEISQFDVATAPKRQTQRELAMLYGLNEDEITSIFHNVGIEGDAVVWSPKMESEVLACIWDTVKIKAQKQHDVLSQYIRQLGLSQKCAVVDVGWHGTIQALLSKCRFKCGTEEISWSGYYIGALSEKNGAVYSGINRRGYLFERNGNQRTEEGVRNSVPFFEMLFLANEGTTVKYTVNSTGEVIPVLGSPENDSAQAEIIEKLQKAGLQFVRDMAESTLPTFMSIDAGSAVGNYLALARVPSNATLRLFRGFQTDEGDLVNPYGAFYYLSHPKKFADDFMKLHGKAWFLKSVMKLPLPYIQILRALRRIQNICK